MIRPVGVFCVYRRAESLQALRKIQKKLKLTFKKPCVLYIGRAYPYPPDVIFYMFFSTTINTKYFKHSAHSPFFSSKCRLFHNATYFGLCIIHILHTGFAKI
jgi:hypothetical protein